MNAHHPEGTSPLLYAAQKNASTAMLSMIRAGGNPEEQDSDWVEFLMAATSTFTQDMGKTVYSMMSDTSVLPVSQHSSASRDAIHCCREAKA